ncbi:hypothetical protein BKA70DRAFT_1388749 [Coprinopsis sp. MPI-PUGE-AT-0042]|nr:hypothetical protein BKA70DRAFT_1388749 [Coprinopsis sp. MPI-PUGE-AT-0042]
MNVQKYSRCSPGYKKYTNPGGANRSTKLGGKLKVLPEQPVLEDEPSNVQVAQKGYAESSGTNRDSDEGDGGESEEESQEDDVEVYNQIALIPAGTARRDALKLTKKKAKSLPRVTAYATANSYRMNDLMKFFVARKSAYHTNPKLIDEVIYTPYVYDPPPSANCEKQFRTEDRPAKKTKSKFDTTSPEAEIFLFPYGTVVIWGMTEPQEKRFLSSIRRFEIGKLASDEIEKEDLNYYYANYSRIYNDVITLRKGSSYMTKLSLSHALSQSVKISLFEELISSTIEETKDIPEIISETGKIGMPHKEIMQQIGQLFLLRTNINSVGSVLDSPEVFWSFPDLQPLYDAARSYLEIPQRINLLNTRVEVLQDMLQLLKESVSSRHAERLEQIVIVLIALEIVLGVITILVDLMA